MRKCLTIWTFLTLCAMFIPNQSALGAGATLDPSTLRLTLPYAQYLGTPYYLTLDFDASKSGPAGLFWKFNSLAPSALQGQCGGIVDPTTLNITDLCVLFVGMQFQITLEFQLTDLTWKLGGGISQLPGVIASGSGACIPDPQCQIDCGSDTDCILTNCIGSPFPVGLTLNNPTSNPIQFTIPPGATFVPGQGDVQTVMLLQELQIQVPPGTLDYCVNAYCMNVLLHAPGGEDSFTTGGGVSQGCLIEILNLTNGKSLSYSDRWQIQIIVWDCIDQGTISAEQRQFLEGL